MTMLAASQQMLYVICEFKLQLIRKICLKLIRSMTVVSLFKISHVDVALTDKIYFEDLGCWDGLKT